MLKNGKLFYFEKRRITLDGSGDGTLATVFEAKFYSTPAVYVVPAKADAGSYTAASVTSTGFTITITGSDILSQDIEVWYFATEKT